MTKRELEYVLDVMKHQSTKTLTKKVAALNQIEDDRALTKRMWFWTDFGNASARKGFVKRYSADYSITLMKGMDVHYARTVEPSRKNAYASDRLYLMDGNTEYKFTVADARKIADGLQNIIERRVVK